MNLDVIFKSFGKIQLHKFNIVAEDLIPDIKSRILNLNFIRLIISELQISDLALLKDLEVSVPALKCNLNNVPSIMTSLRENPPKLSVLNFYIYINALNRILNNKEFLSIEEVEDLNLEIKDNRLHVTGHAHKIITIPFLAVISLRASQDGQKIIVTIEKVQVLGFLPVPGFGLSWALNIVSKKLSFPFIERVGQSFVIDPLKAIPIPVKIKLNFKLEKDKIIVSG